MHGMERVNQSEFIKPLTNKSNNASGHICFSNNKSGSKIKIKSDFNLPKKVHLICFNEKPLKMMKNVLYFIIKILCVLKIFKFLSCLFGNVEKNGLTREMWLISKFVTSQGG